MTGWYPQQTPGRPATAMIAITLLAVLLVAAVPVALLAGVVMMVLGYVTGGLALSGGSVLAAALAVTLAGLSGLRHLRRLLPGDSIPAVRLDASQSTEATGPEHSGHPHLVRLDRSDYTEVR